MKRNVHEALVGVPSKEKLEALKDSLKDFIVGELISSGTFDQAKVKQMIINALPFFDKEMLGIHLPIFKQDVEHYTQGMKSENKKAFASSVYEKVSSSLDFLLS